MADENVTESQGILEVRTEPRVRRTFKDDLLEDHLREYGWVICDVFTDDDLRRASRIIDEIYPLDRYGFQASNFATDFEYRRQLDSLMGPTLEARMAPQLSHYSLYNTLSTSKWPGHDSGFVVHQDWTFVDESRFRGINVWCPLVDTDEHNGGMLVLSGSHRVLNAIRCGPVFPNSYEAPGTKVTWDDMDCVPIKAGQALVFDHRLVHSSGPNLSDTVRHALVGLMMPEEADLMHWHLPDVNDDLLEIMHIDDRFPLEVDVNAEPNYPVSERVKFVPDELTSSELVALCRELIGQDLEIAGQDFSLIENAYGEGNSKGLSWVSRAWKQIIHGLHDARRSE